MVRLFRHHIAVGSLMQLFGDAALFFMAVLLAVYVQEHSPVVSPLGVLIPALSFAALMVVINIVFGLYSRREPKSFGALLGRSFLSVSIGVPLAYLIFTVLPNGLVAQAAIGYMLLYALAGLILIRQAAFSARTTRMGARRVLIVGAGPEAKMVEQALASLGFPQFEVVGFFPVGAADKDVIPVERQLARSALITHLVETLAVREVIVAQWDQRGGKLPMDDLLECRVRGVPVTDLAVFYERTRGEVPIESLKASHLIYGDGFAQDMGRRVVKRSFDFLASAALFTVAFPIMTLAAAVIRLESPGPVIYRQERVGRGGRVFTCLKFRSMGIDAERNGPVWAAKADARVTRVGRFIRKTRIDELPQLWNVLRGEMSFVGPRPERPVFVEQLREQIPFYDVRHSVKPGLTGWAQVRYAYGASVEDACRKLQFDLYYVKNNSLFLDVLILLETVRVVLFREGAH
ncbi:MAG: TIGR03013 family PEP-CTERM/XrtA system glycosyltransferase [Burkholderiaceae bacterium]